MAPQQPVVKGPTNGADISLKSSTYSYLVLPGNESVLMKEAMERRPWWKPCKESSTNWNFWWGGNGQKFDFKSLIGSARSQQPQVVNRLEAHSEVCTKSGLAGNLTRIKQLLPDLTAWIPETYVLSAQGADKGALERFKLAYKRHEAAGTGTTWIVKPTSLNRGNGIEVFNQMEAVIKHIGSKKAGSKWIVQKYIDQPLLVDGRKFDIRAYALLTPDGQVFMHREAYVRTSCTEYKLEELSDKSAHLTNDAVQKQLENYNAFEDHCKMSLQDLQRKVADKGIDMDGKVWPQMRAAVQQLFSMAQPKMNPRRLQYCFELLGLDFMLDEAGQVFLIEVNTSPALFRAGAYLADLLPRVIEEVVQRCIDPFFPPPSPDTLPAPLDGFMRLELLDLGSGARRSMTGAAAGASGKAKVADSSTIARGIRRPAVPVAAARKPARP